jgi:hypothetical protein
VCRCVIDIYTIFIYIYMYKLARTASNGSLACGGVGAVAEETNGRPRELGVAFLPDLGGPVRERDSLVVRRRSVLAAS